MSGPVELILGVSGASGARLGLRAVALLAGSPDVARLHVVVTARALLVAGDEVDPEISSLERWVDVSGLPPAGRKKTVFYSDETLDAPIASGSFKTAGMAVIPCSAGTLGALAQGISRGLLQRAGDVCLKERRPLILALRETPYSLIHAENILRVTQAGAVVAPPVPAFYAARTVEEILDAYLLRVGDLLGVRLETGDYRWKGGA